jgi:hypothetical protein
LINAYTKAIELAPQAQTAANDAAASLDRQAWLEAKPKEEETLRILKEIAEQLPKQPNQDQQQDQQQEQNKDQDQKKKEDQKKKDDQKKDEQKKDEQKKDEKKDTDKQDGKQDDKPKQDSQSKPDSSQQKEKSKQDLSKEQAESLLRQVRERERDYREHQKKRQAVIGGVRVEKDW